MMTRGLYFSQGASRLAIISRILTGIFLGVNSALSDRAESWPWADTSMAICYSSLLPSPFLARSSALSAPASLSPRARMYKT